jgi:hypothetical protein
LGLEAAAARAALAALALMWGSLRREWMKWLRLRAALADAPEAARLEELWVWIY